MGASPLPDGRRSARIDRGSARRLKRIKFRDNWSIDVVIFIAWVLFCLLVLVPWFVRHPQH